MKIILVRSFNTLLVLLLAFVAVYGQSEVIAVDTTYTLDLNQILELIRQGKEIDQLPAEDVTFKTFNDYIAVVVTFLLGAARNLIPKAPDWLKNINLSKIPREITVSVAGVAAVIFMIKMNFTDIDWRILIGSVFGIQGVYSFVKSLVDKIPDNGILGILKNIAFLVLGRFDKFLYPDTPADPQGKLDFNKATTKSSS